jgi:hypothetical protein
MINVNYQKRKNEKLFSTLENKKSLFLSQTQNYIPIYNKFFQLNDTNYKNININHKWYLYNLIDRVDSSPLNNIFNCTLKNINIEKTKEKEVFFKMAPLLDPYKYLIGKYDINNKNLFNLPQLHSTEENVHPKILDPNNSAYIDGLFLFLSSKLNYTSNFIHSLDYYGSFLAIKNDYKLNVFDDLDYLINSDFFIKNKNKLFTIDDYENIYSEKDNKKKPIKINSDKSTFSIQSINDEVFDNVFNSDDSENIIDLQDFSKDLIDISNEDFSKKMKDNNNSTTLNSGSSCSSRTSHTSSNNSNTEDECNNCDNDSDNGSDNGSNKSEKTGDTRWEEDSNSSGSDFEEKIEVTIPHFPIQVICMENCEMTLDDLILNNELSQDEWLSCLLQIIMILITYQKVFAFTHNDLHTNNVMYNTTSKKYIYYKYDNKVYKVPTFGKIFKIIDFGRSIFKFEGKVFCSDSFKTGGDAATQYNTEPYFNDKKPRLEPNFSFDLCRLACSIFDYLVEDIESIKNLNNCSTITKLIVEWCLDDKGINLLYKNNGADRYPDFKLYKMISRHVHNHTPQAQLERNEFKSYIILMESFPSTEKLINIDEMISLI